MDDWGDRALRILAGRDVLVAYLVLLGFIVVAFAVRIPLVQIPGYLLIVGFDLLQNPLAPGVTGTLFDVLLAAYLYLLAVVVAGLYRTVLRAIRGADVGQP